MGKFGQPVRAAVFLDRDGVINQAVVREGKPYPPPSLAEMVILDGVPEALADLRRAGFLLIVVTNQPDVATGITTPEAVEAMHRHLLQTLPIDAIKACFHTGSQGCACRKPLPGMLCDAAGEWGIDLARSFMVGDRWRDVDAGKAAGCRTVFIDYGYDELLRAQPDFQVSSLAEASRIILSLRPGAPAC